MLSSLMDLISDIAFYGILFLVLIGIPLFFIVTLILLIRVMIKNKVSPGKYSKSRIRAHVILFVISLVLLLLAIAAVVTVYLLLLRAVTYM